MKFAQNIYPTWLANFPPYSFIWPYFFSFSTSQFSTLLVYLALLFYEICSKYPPYSFIWPYLFNWHLRALCWFLVFKYLYIFETHHCNWRKSTTELTLSTYSILIPTYTFIHICVLSKNAKLDFSFLFFSGKITFVSTTPPCGHGDESRHCRQASGQTVPQNLHTETWKCQVKYCIATHKLQ